MKITKSYLKQLIKEELENTLNESRVEQRASQINALEDPELLKAQKEVVSILKIVMYDDARDPVTNSPDFYDLPEDVQEMLQVGGIYDGYTVGEIKELAVKIGLDQNHIESLMNQQEGMYESGSSKPSIPKPQEQVNAIIEKMKEMLSKHESGEEKLDSGMVRGLKAALENIKK